MDNAAVMLFHSEDEQIRVRIMLGTRTDTGRYRGQSVCVICGECIIEETDFGIQLVADDIEFTAEAHWGECEFKLKELGHDYIQYLSNRMGFIVLHYVAKGILPKTNPKVFPFTGLKTILQVLQNELRDNGNPDRNPLAM